MRFVRCCVVGLLMTAGAGCALRRTPGPPPTPSDSALARAILADEELGEVRDRAKALLGTGLTAGSGYGEVWIRDLNTFIELALQVNEREEIRRALLTFFAFQGEDGNPVRLRRGGVPRAEAHGHARPEA